jgi:tRNA A37 N6-isopentenylltransferase MiaA
MEQVTNKKGELKNEFKVLCVIGSTGSGKTKLSVDLATKFNGEIINCDVMQVIIKFKV